MLENLAVFGESNVIIVTFGTYMACLRVYSMYVLGQAVWCWMIRCHLKVFNAINLQNSTCKFH